MEFATPEAAKAYWEAEYEFWYKIIAGEVTRNRLSRGVETIEIDLYPMATNARALKQPELIGKTHIGRALYYAIGQVSFDKEGNKVLKVKLFVP